MSAALVVNILVFDLRVQLQHCTYQRKTLLFALIKVSTFICKREILGCSSPLMNLAQNVSNSFYYFGNLPVFLFVNLSGCEVILVTTNLLFQGIIHLVIGSLGVDAVTSHTFYGMRLEHPPSQSAYWLRRWFTVQEIHAKYDPVHPAEECR